MSKTIFEHTNVEEFVLNLIKTAPPNEAKAILQAYYEWLNSREDDHSLFTKMASAACKIKIDI
jgi:hypothetical protein